MRTDNTSLLSHSELSKHFLRMIRPSLLDLRFTGDPWIVEQEEGTFTLFLGDTCLAGIAGVTLDLPSLNQVLDRMRHRRPRPRFQVTMSV